jgi:hypothetical protein
MLHCLLANALRVAAAKKIQKKLSWMQTGDGLIPLKAIKTATPEHLGINQYVQTMKLVQENVPLMALIKMIC